MYVVTKGLRKVVIEGMACQSVNPISTRGADYAHHSTTVLTMLKYVPAALIGIPISNANIKVYCSRTAPFYSVKIDR